MKAKMSVDLTSRETQIIELVIQGARNKDICDLLYISENTVKTHLQNIYSKLDVNSKAKLVTFAFQNQIGIPPDMATSD
ncbi:MAG: response regulator transcription factor [Leptospiraceae bacterium]|nr:response regulator transcription factor [Leptospiraceae bacterium]